MRQHLQPKTRPGLWLGLCANLKAEVSRRSAEIERTQRVGLSALAHLAEMRDPETGNHLLRTQAYMRLLAEQLRRQGDYRKVLSDHTIELLVQSAPLHDIGKVGIPDRILLKPGKLDAEEWAVMRTHAAIGASAIERAEAGAGGSGDFLRLAREIAHWHHEQWDGSGYPDGLRGEQIPLSARLMALADVFDALMSPRVYKVALSFERARSIILAGSGRHFDPAVVEAFAGAEAAFQAIAIKHSDSVDETRGEALMPV